MEYREIKDELDKKRRQLQNFQNHNTGLGDDISALKLSISTIEGDKENEISYIRKEELKKYELEITFPFDSKIKDLEDKKIEARKKTDGIIEKYKSPEYKTKIKGTRNVTEEMEHCDAILNKSKDFYGERFANICTNIVVATDTDSFKIEEVLPNVREKMQYIRSNTDYIGLFNDKLDAVLKFEEDKNKEAMIGVSILGGLLVVICIVFYQILLVVILAVILLNVYKSKFLFDCLSSAKSLKDNIAEVEEALDRDIDNKISNEIAKADNKYNSYISKINEKIQKLEDDCIIEVERAMPNFIFNSAEIEEKYLMMVNNKKSRLDMLEQDLRTTGDKIRGARTEIQDLEVLLERSIGTIIDSYFCKSLTGKVTFPDDYLIDIENNVPMLLKTIKGCCIFTYDSEVDLDKFIELLFFQTISRMNPDVIRFSYIDQKYMGRLLFPFRNDKDNKDNSIVDICKEDSTTKTHISDVLKELNKRMSMFISKPTIEDYNEEMNSLGAILEAYRVIIHRNPDMSLFNDKEYSQILINGGQYGFYSYVFIDLKEFNKSNLGPLKSLIEQAKAIHHIDGEKVRKRAKLFYINKLESEE